MRALATAVALLATAALSPAGASAAVRPKQELAELVTPHDVVARLHASARSSTIVQPTRPLTGGPTVLPVVSHGLRGGRPWLKVLLPGRPNGHTGWIAARGTVPSTTRWHVVIRRSTRRVRVYRDGHLVRDFAAIVGKPSTPTPQGSFFVEESIRLAPGSAGAPFALATSARSNVLQEFAGGPGQIGIHGVQNLGGTPGTAVSHGCVRLPDSSIRWMVSRIGPGVPVTIR